MARNINPRMSIVNLNPSILQVPFSFIQKQFGYSVISILRKIHCESSFHLGVYPDTFPNTITEYYWISTEANQWYALGKMENGLYFFYMAHCTSTFLNGKGSMYLWVSRRYASLVEFAMDELVYEKYINETIVV